MKEIPLTQGYVALVDDEDYDRVVQFNWHAVKGWLTWYAVSTIDGRKVHLHRLLLSPDQATEVDHKDGDGLNCRRDNLRPASHRQNGQNRPQIIGVSGYRGVHRNGRRWAARVHNAEGIPTHLGQFDSPKEAALAYNEAARRYHGEFAVLNILE